MVCYKTDNLTPTRDTPAHAQKCSFGSFRLLRR